jgi:hypothetical protein
MTRYRRTISFLSLLGLAGCGPGPESTPGAGSSPLLQERGAPLFREAERETGLRFRHNSGATGSFYFPEIMGAGVALLDYDGDGDLDVFLLQGSVLGVRENAGRPLFPAPERPGSRLFRNEIEPGGTLRFVDVTELAGLAGEGHAMGVAVGDIDNDGDSDLYVTRFGANVFYRNNGDGTFSDITSQSGADDPRWSTSASFLDYDNDGDLDLFFTHYVDFSMTHHRRCVGLSDKQDYCGPQSYDPVPDKLFRNDGGNRFSDVTTAAGLDAAFGAGLGVSTADFNRDGWMDIYVANDQSDNQLWMNRGDGRFENTGLMSGTAYNAHGKAEASMGVTAGDVDGDGDDDLFMTHLASETNTLYVNDGSGNFYDATDQFRLGSDSFPYTGFGSRWFDYDNDGALDLLVANGRVEADPMQVGRLPYPYGEVNQLFRNEGDGSFSNRGTQSDGEIFKREEVGRGVAFGDIDNDGDIDVVVSNNNGPVRLLLNELQDRHHWISVKLTGTESSRDGTGARVAMLRGDRAVAWRRAHRDGSYLSSSDIRIHFGLGEDASVEGIGVIWPGGRRERWDGFKGNQQISLTEGTGEDWNSAAD